MVLTSSVERPPVVLLTDFGHADPYVGIMKGVILSVAPGLSIVDLCHTVPPQDLRTGEIGRAHV